MDSDFRALCWGSNSKGQLGLDTETVTSRAAPVYVENLPQGVIQIAVGGEHTCALLESGAVKCWGSNEKGQLGNGGNENSSVPVDVVGLDSGVIAIDAGDAHTCALKEDGSVHCWGDNDKGELGNGNTDQQNVPVQVTGLLRPALQFSTGPEFNCVLDSANEAWCWGHGSFYNHLGDGESKDSSSPVQVKNFN
jgi:alpha-tubulin suppressor-like RCC1 family protein